jgi:hypothetical protein
MGTSVSPWLQVTLGGLAGWMLTAVVAAIPGWSRLRQGLTLVHFSAQRKLILWDRSGA